MAKLQTLLQKKEESEIYNIPTFGQNTLEYSSVESPAGQYEATASSLSTELNLLREINSSKEEEIVNIKKDVWLLLEKNDY